MLTISPPAYALDVLKTLETAGHAAYLVGGCVRDSLMGRRPQDWDVCTDASPEKILSIFPDSKPTGLKHGTVTVGRAGGHVEVTTFRADGDYSDHRRPDSVRFTSDLNEDLSRRDFSVNAMALSAAGALIDPFGGQADLAARLIRCVGEPDARFEEDALRMFRALRFSAQLDFSLESKTETALTRKAGLAVFLAPERIRDELEKTLLSPRPAIALRTFQSGLMAGYASRPGAAVRAPSRRPPGDRLARWAWFCGLLEDGRAIDGTAAFLTALRLDRRTIRHVGTGVSLALAGLPEGIPGLKRLLAKYGADTVRCAAVSADTLSAGHRLRDLNAILDGGDCWSLSRLAVTGDDLLPLGYKGRALGAALGSLLERVIERPELNEKGRLLALLTELS